MCASKASPRASSALWSQFLDWLLHFLDERLGPLLWPHLTEVCTNVANRMLDRLIAWADARSKLREENARLQAELAEQKAASAKTAEEAASFRAVAQVWRTIAEEFRRENEELKEQLRKATAQAASDFDLAIVDVKFRQRVNEDVRALIPANPPRHSGPRSSDYEKQH